MNLRASMGYIFLAKLESVSFSYLSNAEFRKYQPSFLSKCAAFFGVNNPHGVVLFSIVA